MRLSSREKVLVLASALMVLGYIAVVYMVDPFLESQREVREQLDARRSELASLRALAGERSRYQRRVDDLRVRVADAESLLLEENKIPIVAAEIQERIHQYGLEAGVSIVRESVLRPKDHEQFVEVPVELSVKGALREIHAFLYKVEMNEKLLTVPKFVIRSPLTSTGALSLDLHIAGHIATGGKL